MQKVTSFRSLSYPFSRARGMPTLLIVILLLFLLTPLLTFYELQVEQASERNQQHQQHQQIALALATPATRDQAQASQSFKNIPSKLSSKSGEATKEMSREPPPISRKDKQQQQLQDNDNPLQTHQSYQQSAKKKEKQRILFNIVAVGSSKERNDIIKHNLIILKKKGREYEEKYIVDCQIYVYSNFEGRPDWIKEMEKDQETSSGNVKDGEMESNYFENVESPSPAYPTHIHITAQEKAEHTSKVQQNLYPQCRIIYTFQMGYNAILRQIDPFLLIKAGYDYLFILLDDISLIPPYGNFDLEKFLDLSIGAGLEVSSPSILDSDHAEMRPHPLTGADTIGRYVTLVEAQLVLVSLPMWKCWHSLIDLEYPHGWQDMYVWKYCVEGGKAKSVPLKDSKKVMGVLDVMYVTHNILQLPSTHNLDGEKSINSFIEGQKAAWSAQRGIELERSTCDTIGVISGELK